jgi:MoxR-like ATPase
MLTDVPVINQESFKNITQFTIRNGGNILVLGPSGGGKTKIAQQAAKEEGCELIYINLAVLERTDFQGFPVISDDKKYVNYAVPEFLPFNDVKNLSNINNISLVLKNAKEGSQLHKNLSTFLSGLTVKSKNDNLTESIYNIKELVPDNIRNDKDFISLLVETSPTRPVVILFDEVDKALPETNQILLELLQFSSINGRKLNIKACILTGNLPDEHAHVNQISHAISKRCKTFKLDISFNIWQTWAIKNNIHTNVVQFLSSDPKMLNVPAPDGDTTAYAMPSPRTWEYVSDTLYSLEKEKYTPKNDDDILLLKLISGSIGDIAATKYSNWFKYYKKYDPIINDLITNGTHPNTTNLSEQNCLVLGVSACSKLYNSLNKTNTDEDIKKIVNNVFNWLTTLNENIQIGSIRLSFGGDYSICETYNLTEIDSFKNVFIKVKEKMQEFDTV